MESLFDKYQRILENGDWKYYPELRISSNPFESETDAGDFITDYLVAAGKEKILSPLNLHDNPRRIHSVSCFFLGIILMEFLNLKNNNAKETQGKNDPSFIYFWFIACLYHDYGYNLEREYPKRRSIPDLKELLNILKIENNLLDTEFPKLYSEELLFNYYNYFVAEKHSINHGYVGSLLIYDSLIKNYNYNREEAINQQIPGAIEEDFIYKNLHWDKEHKKFYKRIADVILFHNIWFCTKPEYIEKYNRFGLSELIIKNPKQRVSPRDNQLLFLLLLADTIEPVKDFGMSVLKKVNFRIIQNKHKQLVITIINHNDFDYLKWFTKIKDLQTWVQVKINYKKKQLIIHLDK